MLIKELLTLVEARRVPKGTFSGSDKKTDNSQVKDFRNVEFDPSNPYHADEKARREAEKAKQPKYSKIELSKKARDIVKKCRADARSADELGPTDFVDMYVNHHKDPALWTAVMDLLM